MSLKKSKNVPNSVLSRDQNKSVRATEISVDTKPAWRFSTVDKGGPFAWPKGTKTESDIVVKLHDFDSMTWSQITGSDHHSLSADSLSPTAVKRLHEINLDDEMENIFTFHLRGKPRIVCIRDRNIAKLLWFDPNHEVCKSKKR